MIQNGDRVAFCGDPAPGGPSIGDQGRVVQAGHTGSGVRWVTGALSGQISELVAHADLVVNGSLDGHSFAQHFSTGHPSEDALQAQATFARSGARATLRQLHEAGLLSNFTSIAEDVASMVARRIQQDPELAPILAQLDPDDASELVAVASGQLLRDAFGRGEG